MVWGWVVGDDILVVVDDDLDVVFGGCCGVVVMKEMEMKLKLSCYTGRIGISAVGSLGCGR